jgi:hypothetical protein
MNCPICIDDTKAFRL